MKQQPAAASGGPAAGPVEPDAKPVGESDEETMDFTMDELREFLEADQHEVPADPAFKERLRDKLWELVQSRAAALRAEK